VKTQIIQLNQNDDIVSVRDKMSWCQTGRILLVWPVQGRVLRRQLDLILAKRYAITLGSELALATSDPEVRFNAQQVGIPTFTNLRHAEEQDWGTSRPQQLDHRARNYLVGLDELRKSIRLQTPVWMDRPAVRILCLGLSVMALVALAIFILPGAKVILSPKEDYQSVKLDLIGDPSATSVNLSTGSLPTYRQEVTVVGTDSITTTGTMTIPHEPASGMLKFTNRSKADITLPIGTIVSTLGSNQIRFKTTSLDDIVIKPNKSALVEAQAIRPGTTGNLPPNSLVGIEGDLGLELVVTNPKATSGGLDATVPTSSLNDLQSLHEQLTSTLQHKALMELQSNLPVDDTLIAPSTAIIEVVEETYTPTIGEPADQVQLLLRLKINAQVVSGEVLRKMATPILDANIPTGYAAIMDSLVITPINTPTLGADGKAYWSVNASRRILAEIPSSQAVESIKGATIANAIERLNNVVPLAKPADIELEPTWWPRLPLLAMRITLFDAGTQ
jgi:hypothetical protein